MEKNIKLVIRFGLKSFLVDAFGDKYTGKVMPYQLARQLYDFKDVSDDVIRRKQNQCRLLN